MPWIVEDLRNNSLTWCSILMLDLSFTQNTDIFTHRITIGCFSKWVSFYCWILEQWIAFLSARFYKTHILNWVDNYTPHNNDLSLKFTDFATLIMNTEQTNIARSKMDTSSQICCYCKTKWVSQMLSSVTPNCQVTMIAMNSGSQLSEMSTILHVILCWSGHVLSPLWSIKCFKGHRSLR